MRKYHFLALDETFSPLKSIGSFVINFKRVGMSPLILAASKTEGSFLLTAYDLLTEFEIH